MRAFRFRLAALKRIKRHQIEAKEREISRLEAEIQRRLAAIDEGRHRLAKFRRMLLEETPEVHSVEVEWTEASVRGYILSVEVTLYQEIDQLRKEQEARQAELVALYQEEKMLERLRDRQHAAWQQEAQREELYLLDEIGGQAHLRRHREPAGGAMLIVLGAVALIAAAGATLVLLGKHKPILERVGLLRPPATEAAPAEIASATSITDQFTIRDLYGDPDRPASEVLGNLLAERRKMKAREREIDERQARLETERELLVESQKQLAGKLGDVQSQLDELDKAQQEEQARLKSLHAQRVTEISNALQRMKPKGAADLLAEMWTSQSTDGPDPKEIVLEVFRGIPATKRNKVLDALVKSNKTETAGMILEFINQPEPTPTPSPSASPTPSPPPTNTPAPASTS